jgi:hypothetical protein
MRAYYRRLQVLLLSLSMQQQHQKFHRYGMITVLDLFWVVIFMN